MTWRSALACAFLLVACQGAPVDRTGSGELFYVISGPVEVEGLDADPDVGGAIAWFVLRDGELGGVVDAASLQSRFSGYAMEVAGPPDADGVPLGTTVGDVLGALEGVTLLVGLPLLVRSPGAQDPSGLEPFPAGLEAWLFHATPAAADLLGPDPGGDTLAVALTRDFLLMGLGGDDPLSSWPGFDGQVHCALSAVETGLTVYRRGADGCGAWEALAPPGTRDEFQGIPMGAAAP